MTREEFKSTENEYVSQRAKEQLVLMALQEETGITATGEKYRQYTAVYGVNEDDPDKTLFEVITEEIRERIELLECEGRKTWISSLLLSFCGYSWELLSSLGRWCENRESYSALE